jgi:hypothetical protein
LILDLLDALVTHVDARDPFNTCLIVCGDFNLDVSGKELKDIVSSKGFQIHPGKQQRKRHVDFALVRGSLVNVLYCEPRDPDLTHHQESKAVSPTTELLPSIKGTANIKQENGHFPGKTQDHDETEESPKSSTSDNGDFHEHGLQTLLHCLLVDFSSIAPQQPASFDHTFFHLVVEVNCVNNVGAFLNVDY